ncbi:MAG: hypothetical protein ACE5F5_12850, partial [Acidimicrobiia bacterium]
MTARDPLSPLLAAVFQRVSDAIAGPDRFSLPPLEAAEAEAASLLPEDGKDAVDPDLIPPGPGDPFTPEVTADLPGPAPTPAFDPSALPQAEEGEFVNVDGMIRFTRNVGEAPDNKANRDHPAYKARAEFVSQVRQYVLETFNVSDAGQFRSLDAEVTANRSTNSDHYSGGAFDVRASSPQEAQEILVWASQQPWVAFAQVYPNDTLIHISANIALFGGQAQPEV